MRTRPEKFICAFGRAGRKQRKEIGERVDLLLAHTDALIQLGEIDLRQELVEARKGLGEMNASLDRERAQSEVLQKQNQDLVMAAKAASEHIQLLREENTRLVGQVQDLSLKLNQIGGVLGNANH